MMARKKSSNKKIINTIISIIILLVLSLISQNEQIQETITGKKHEMAETTVSRVDDAERIVIGTGDVDSQDNLFVYFIDVGQADSILIINKNESMLIDAGNNEDGDEVVEFIKSKGISKLNYIVGTHPHEDHIGGLDDVINNFEFDKIYLPKIQTTTKTYQSVLEAIKNKNKTISSFSKEDKLELGDAKLEVMTDSILDKSNLNLSSNIIKLEFNETTFLFTGDAETKNENSVSWEQVDILKVGHHGSKTSTSQNFLDQIKPKYAIISVGKDNDYGLPKEEIIERLKNIGAEIFRTDELGTIEIIVTK